MLEITVYDGDGRPVGTRALDEQVFGGEVRPKLMREAVLMYEAAARSGTASTKTRAEVCGSGSKPWRQKGTGRARSGSRKSPIWRGGGAIFGPHPRDFSYPIPRKALQAALRSALLAKFLDDEVTLVDRLELSEAKTKQAAALLRRLNVHESCLIGTDRRDEMLWKSTRNIPSVELMPVSDLNAYVVLKQRRLLLTVPALNALVERFGGGAAS